MERLVGARMDLKNSENLDVMAGKTESSLNQGMLITDH